MRLAACLVLICALCVSRIRAEVPAGPGANDDTALQELLRGADGVIRHWNQAPGLVVLDTVMTYRTGEVRSFTATSERWTDADVDGLVNDLTVALRLLTGDAYIRFASVLRESV